MSDAKRSPEYRKEVELFGMLERFWFVKTTRAQRVENSISGPLLPHFSRENLNCFFWLWEYERTRRSEEDKKRRKNQHGDLEDVFTSKKKKARVGSPRRAPHNFRLAACYFLKKTEMKLKVQVIYISEARTHTHFYKAHLMMISNISIFCAKA